MRQLKFRGMSAAVSRYSLLGLSLTSIVSAVLPCAPIYAAAAEPPAPNAAPSPAPAPAADATPPAAPVSDPAIAAPPALATSPAASTAVEPVSGPAPIQLGLEVLTDFPVQVGGRLWLELPYRIRISTTLGALPGPYVDAINAILVASGAYDRTTADLIRAALQESLVFRLHGGWRPLRRRGGYFELGYGLVGLGGGITGQQIIAAASGSTPPTDSSNSSGYDVRSILHMVDIELGWQWPVWRGLTFRVALGCALTAWSSTEVTPKNPSRFVAAQERFASSAEQYLDSTYRSYVFTPTFTFATGWRALPWLGRGW